MAGKAGLLFGLIAVPATWLLFGRHRSSRELKAMIVLLIQTSCLRRSFRKFQPYCATHCRGPKGTSGEIPQARGCHIRFLVDHLIGAQRDERR
jgi:hypothetical protein